MNNKKQDFNEIEFLNNLSDKKKLKYYKKRISYYQKIVKKTRKAYCNNVMFNVLGTSETYISACNELNSYRQKYDRLKNGMRKNK